MEQVAWEEGGGRSWHRGVEGGEGWRMERCERSQRGDADGEAMREAK